MQIVCAYLQRTFFHPQLADLPLLNGTSFVHQWLPGLGPIGILGNSTISAAWSSAHFQFIEFL